MDAELDKVISELDDNIASCKKRLEAILSALKWTEDGTLRDKSAINMQKEDSEDEDDPPLPQSFGCENSVTIGVDQLKAITRDETSAIAKRFTDIQSNYTREQKLDIYDYVINNTKKLKEPEVKVTVLNNNQAATDMTIAQIVAKAKANAKIQSRKYSTSKPTHIEEIREMIKLQMQALNQSCKPHASTSRKARLDVLSPIKAPSKEDGYRRSKSRDGRSRSPFRRPSLDMIKPFRVPSCDRSKNRRKSRDGRSPLRIKSKSRDGGSPFRGPSLDTINPFRAPSCESTSSRDRSQGGGSQCGEVRNPFRAKRSEDRAEFRSSERSKRERSRENSAFGSPPVDRMSRNRGRGFRGREQSVDLRRPPSVDLLHRMSDRTSQINDESAVKGTRLRLEANRGKELSSSGDRTQQTSDRSDDQAKKKTNPFRDKAATSSGRATQSKDWGSQCRDKSSESNIYQRMDTVNRSGERWTQNRDERSRSKSLPKRGGLESDEQEHERRDRGNQAKNLTAFRRCSQSSDRRQSWINRESDRRDLNDCSRDLSGDKAERGRWSLNRSRDEKDEMYRRKSQSTDEKSRRDKRNHSRSERRDCAARDKCKSRDRRSRSSSKTKSRGKRSQVKSK